MGEMADYFLEQVEADEWARQDYYDGRISTDEAHDRGLIDEFGCVITAGRKASVTCRCCETSGLHWEKKKGKWRLFDANGLHNCPTNPLRERDEDN